MKSCPSCGSKSIIKSEKGMKCKKCGYVNKKLNKRRGRVDKKKSKSYYLKRRRNKFIKEQN